MRRRPPRSTPTDPLFPCTPPFRSLGGWFALGLSYAASITPGGRLLRRSSGADDRPALFAAQFALSHVCWLIAYPLAGQRSEEHTSELQSLMRISYAGFCLKKKSNPSHIVRYP